MSDLSERRVVGSREDISVESSLYDTAVATLIGMRRTMLVISTILGLGAMHTYEWYLSWDHARIAAREGILAQVADGVSVYAEPDADQKGEQQPSEIKGIRDGLARLKEAQLIRMQSLPLIGMEVPSADYSVALLLLGTAMLLWVVLFQRKALACLEEVEIKIGWPVSRVLLRHNSLLIGDSGSRFERFAGYLLFLGLALLATVCLASDIVDLWRMKANGVGSLAFESVTFIRLVWWRLGAGGLLMVTLWVLGVACLKQHRKMEDLVLRYAKLAAKSG